MKIIDKAQWHIDAGENSSAVVSRFKAVFDFLCDKNLLTAEGMEIVDIGIDASVSLHERLVTPEGEAFLEKYYDQVIGLQADEIKSILERSYSDFRA